ncbi:hypothetical protein D3C72_608930 [compost metagenome]
MRNLRTFRLHFSDGGHQLTHHFRAFPRRSRRINDPLLIAEVGQHRLSLGQLGFRFGQVLFGFVDRTLVGAGIEAIHNLLTAFEKLVSDKLRIPWVESAHLQGRHARSRVMPNRYEAVEAFVQAISRGALPGSGITRQKIGTRGRQGLGQVQPLGNILNGGMRLDVFVHDIRVGCAAGDADVLKHQTDGRRCLSFGLPYYELRFRHIDRRRYEVVVKRRQ